MANIFDVAKYILKTVGGEISTMKLQKLCYYSQAWHMVWNEGKRLFEEDFEKWDNGPVCKKLFDLHKGHFKIPADFIADKFLSSEELSLTEQEDIDSVVDFLGKYDAGQLSEMTHLEDPWKDAKKNEVIKKDVIYTFYKNRK